MITTDELRRLLGPLGIWMPPPARNGGSDRLIDDVVPHGREAALAGISAHPAAGADHVVVQLLGERGRFAAGDLAALAELTAGLR
jgi:hypothetical protein